MPPEMVNVYRLKVSKKKYADTSKPWKQNRTRVRVWIDREDYEALLPTKFWHGAATHSKKG